jgi:excisionase family DNA binding protein
LMHGMLNDGFIKKENGKMSMTEDVMMAVLGASEERKAAALKVLRGEVPPGNGGAKGGSQGPILLGMGNGAKYLGVSRATLWRILQSGKIGKVELFPGSYRLRREDLEKLAAGAFGMSGVKSKRGRPRKHPVGMEHIRNMECVKA